MMCKYKIVKKTHKMLLEKGPRVEEYYIIKKRVLFFFWKSLYKGYDPLLILTFKTENDALEYIIKLYKVNY